MGQRDGNEPLAVQLGHPVGPERPPYDPCAIVRRDELLECRRRERDRRQRPPAPPGRLLRGMVLGPPRPRRPRERVAHVRPPTGAADEAPSRDRPVIRHAPRWPYGPAPPSPPPAPR